MPSVCYVTEIKLSGALNVIKISCKYIEKIPNNINLFIDNNERCSNICRNFAVLTPQVFKILLTIFDLLQI